MITTKRLLDLERAGSILSEMEIGAAVRLEQLIDKDDPEQVALVELIKTHSRARGALFSKLEELRKKHGVELI